MTNNRRLLLYVFLIAATLCAAANDFSNETLRYKVMYKWGLINKTAGHASLTIRTVGADYVTQLTAASEPWADHFYMVRDTLNGRIERAGFKPYFYEKIAHEGSEHKHDVVRYRRSGATVTGYCARRVIKKGTERVNERRTVSAVGTTVDMLSSFYYMRSLPFEKWQPGYLLTINIFSGKRKELLTIQYHGVTEIEFNDERRQCYYITFIFTGDEGKKTSDDMSAWISTDSNRVPLKLEGKLPVGKVMCLLE